MSIQKVIRFEMSVPVTVKQDGDWFISACPLLDVFSQGDTHDKAVSNIIEALQLFISSCYERGTLDKVLKESGFHSAPGIESIPVDEGMEIVDVPLPLMANYAENHAY
ncbi:MAG: type II toxin-antitoxin system HicB family antitoxin [Candidatus Thiodiazotropha sp. (ex Troendleina suluensis)]|nr:type II toxin-antitoxin system HicB family antitoxin [Candidatus Thiodiazotropha sp. (ex Troendleina suluensis)]